MPEHRDPNDPIGPERNPLGLGPRDRESSNTGSTDDTSYDARGADPYLTGEPQKDFGDRAAGAGPSPLAEEDVPSSEEP